MLQIGNWRFYLNPSIELWKDFADALFFYLNRPQHPVIVQCSVNVQNILEIFKTIWTSPKYYATSKRMPLKTHLAQWPRVILNSNLSFLQIKLHTKNLELLDKIYKKKPSYSILFLE